MPAPIVTLVEGTPESCRATANELSRVGSGVDGVGTGLFRVRSESESCWTGQAGDAFRESMSAHGKAANDLGEATSRAQKALEAFADELHTVIARMNQARAVAAEHGLKLTPTTIEPPGPRPPEPTLEPPAPGVFPGRDSLAEFEAASAAIEAYERKVRGFEEAKATVDDARRIEADAHTALNAALKYEVDALAHVLAGGVWNAEAFARGMVTTPQSLADKFAKQADTLFERAAKANSAIDAPGLTPAQQASRAALRDRLLKQSTSNQAASTRIQNAANRMYSRTGLNAGIARTLGTSVKGVPVVGTTIGIGLQAEAVIDDGKPAGKALANVAGSTLGGIGTVIVGGACVSTPIGAVVVAGTSVVMAGVGSWVGEWTYDQATEGGNSR